MTPKATIRRSGRLLTLRTSDELRGWSDRHRSNRRSIGLVPTMGALHKGHDSLIGRARLECDRVVVSIFVNPIQFGPNEDFDRYPRPLSADLARLRVGGVDAVFLPDLTAMYPEGASTVVRVPGPVSEAFEAGLRPGTFDGRALVIAKLFVASRADRAYFGYKDAQQCELARRLAADLDTGVDVVVGATVRDDDGVAVSSRNAFLTLEQRRSARAIPAALAAAAMAFAAGETEAARLHSIADDRVRGVSGLTVGYVAVVGENHFTPVDRVGRGCQILILVRIGTTHLIDGIRLGIDEVPRVAPPEDRGRTVAIGMVGSEK